MLRRILTSISAVLLMITLVAWGASYWNCWWAGNEVIVWLREGAVAWDEHYLSGLHWEHEFIERMTHVEASAEEEQWILDYQEMLATRPSASSRGHLGFFGWRTPLCSTLR